ncbi:hypothetical protein IKF25_01450 [Candidatus Saccharibacteria bacterium]|nr:hypothetical protein [Candidatus Saccharibacteria bacterium]
MKKHSRQLSRKKRTVLAASAVGVLLLVGVTVAVSHDFAFFGNLFKLGYYQTEFIETFDSPEDWTPCDETPKTVIAKNDSDTKIYVRLKYDEYWRAKDNVTDLPLVKDGVTLAEIIFQNETDWNLRDGWYYYKTPLNPGESTNSLFKAVKLSCNADFGTDNVCHDTAEGSVCEKPADQYEEAKYHLFVTVQTISEDGIHEWIPEQHIADCDNPTLLYDIIACQSNGTDENINFNERASSNFDSSNGVNTVYAHRNDEFPVHYFRGNPSNNYLEYNGFCWRLVRTAEGGGVKMIYSGEKASDGCTATDIYVDTPSGSKHGYYQSAYTVPGDTPSTVGPLSRDEPSHLGYMFDGEEDHFEIPDNMMFGRQFGKDVSWDGEKYTLVDTIRFTGNPFGSDHVNNYSYVCIDRNSINTTQCIDVYYYSSFMLNGDNTSLPHGIRLTNGDKIEDAFRKIRTNTKDSDAKKVIDNWFANNITTNRDALADVVYCNDREFQMTSNNGKMFWLYDGYARMLGLDNNGLQKPSVDCTNKNDAFTVSSETGNGALTYPAAMLTGDELMLAGFCMATAVNSVYDTTIERCAGESGENYLDGYYWTMTPLLVHANTSTMARGYVYEWIDVGYAGGATDYFRPVVALKYNVEVEGSGTQADPYRIK